MASTNDHVPSLLCTFGIPVTLPKLSSEPEVGSANRCFLTFEQRGARFTVGRRRQARLAAPKPRRPSVLLQPIRLPSARLPSAAHTPPIAPAITPTKARRPVGEPPTRTPAYITRARPAYRPWWWRRRRAVLRRPAAASWLAAAPVAAVVLDAAAVPVLLPSAERSGKRLQPSVLKGRRWWGRPGVAQATSSKVAASSETRRIQGRHGDQKRTRRQHAMA